jgi:lipopolysaccharide biosynthesis glycosyltransferase
MRLATYFRLLLPELLGADYRRILYLDVDVYPESDKVFALFDLDMRGHAVAAVRGLLHAAGTQEARTVLRKGGNKYLNAGVLLIDNARSAETEMTSRALDTARTRPVPLGAHDQSILNYLLDGDWLELSPSFNMIVPVWKSSVRRAFEPVIVHFAGSGKPWEGPRFSIDHPAGHLRCWHALAGGRRWPRGCQRLADIHRPPVAAWTPGARPTRRPRRP